jgi:hypothetical protein
MPMDNPNSAVGEAAFSALSCVWEDSTRLRSYFLKGFSFGLGLILPIRALMILGCVWGLPYGAEGAAFAYRRGWCRR